MLVYRGVAFFCFFHQFPSNTIQPLHEFWPRTPVERGRHLETEVRDSSEGGRLVACPSKVVPPIIEATKEKHKLEVLAPKNMEVIGIFQFFFVFFWYLFLLTRFFLICFGEALSWQSHRMSTSMRGEKK